MVERLRAELSEPPAERIARLGGELDLERALVLVTGGLDGLYEATVRAGAERHRGGERDRQQPRRRRRRPGPGATPRELARLVEARERIPRQVFDEAISKAGDAGFSADALPCAGGGLATHRSSSR